MGPILKKMMRAGCVVLLSVASHRSGHATVSTQTYSTALFSIDLPVSWHTTAAAPTTSVGSAAHKVAPTIFLSFNARDTASIGVLVSTHTMTVSQAWTAEQALLSEESPSVKHSVVRKTMNGVTFVGETESAPQGHDIINTTIYLTLSHQHAVYLLTATDNGADSPSIMRALTSFHLH